MSDSDTSDKNIDFEKYWLDELDTFNRETIVKVTCGWIRENIYNLNVPLAIKKLASLYGGIITPNIKTSSAKTTNVNGVISAQKKWQMNYNFIIFNQMMINDHLIIKINKYLSHSKKLNINCYLGVGIVKSNVDVTYFNKRSILESDDAFGINLGGAIYKGVGKGTHNKTVKNNNYLILKYMNSSLCIYKNDKNNLITHIERIPNDNYSFCAAFRGDVSFQIVKFGKN